MRTAYIHELTGSLDINAVELQDLIDSARSVTVAARSHGTGTFHLDGPFGGVNVTVTGEYTAEMRLLDGAASAPLVGAEQAILDAWQLIDAPDHTEGASLTAKVEDIENAITRGNEDHDRLERLMAKAGVRTGADWEAEVAALEGAVMRAEERERLGNADAALAAIRQHLGAGEDYRYADLAMVVGTLANRVRLIRANVDYVLPRD